MRLAAVTSETLVSVVWDAGSLSVIDRAGLGA